MLWYTKQWLVRREVAVEGKSSPAAQRVTFWDVPDMIQTRIGATINFVIVALIFGVDMYHACVTSGQ